MIFDEISNTKINKIFNQVEIFNFQTLMHSK